MKQGTCKICGKDKPVDSSRICSDCYRYDNATDMYKQDLESRRHPDRMWGRKKYEV